MTLRQIDFSDGFTSASAPDNTGLKASSIKFQSYTGEAAFIADNGTAVDGDAFYDTTEDNLKIYENGAWVLHDISEHKADTSTHGVTGAIVGTNDVQSLSNKTFTDALIISDVTDSSSKDTGSIITEGGIGVEKNVYVGGKIETVGNLDIGGNATITGDLTVNGTTTTLDTATLDVTDANITVNVGGTQAAADTNNAGLTVEMSDATDCEIGYDSTTTSKFKVGEVGSTQEIVTTGHTQTLTSKTLTGASIQTPSRLDVKQDTKANLDTYASTASNGQLVFATDEKKTYQVIDGFLSAVGGVAGAGDLATYVSERAEEDNDVSAWSTGNNATFMGGGTLAGTFALNTTNPIQGTQDWKYTQAAGSLNDYFASKEYTVYPRSQERENLFGFVYTYDGDNGDIAAVLYDETNDTVLSSSLDVLETSSGVSKFYLTAYMPSTCTSIRVGFHVKVANAGAVLYFDDKYVTDNPFVYKELSNNKDLTSCTFSITGSSSSPTGVTDNSNYSIIAGNIKGDLFLSIPSATKGSGYYEFTLPDGLEFNNNLGLSSSLSDTTAAAITLGSHIGSGSSREDGGVSYNLFDVYVGTTYNKFILVYPRHNLNTDLDVQRGNVVGSDDVVLTAHKFKGSFFAPLQNWSATSEHVVTPASATSESIIYTGYTSGTTSVKLSTLLDDQTSKLITATNTTETRYTFNEDCFFSANAVTRVTNTVLNIKIVNSSGTTLYSSDSFSSAGQRITSSLNGHASKGDYLLLECSLALPDSNLTSFSVVAIPKYASFNAAVPVERVAYVKYSVASGANGGTFTAGSYQTRPLNTLEGDTGFISLATNQITLSAGKYDVEGLGSVYNVSSHRAALYNVTTSSYDILGFTNYHNTTATIDMGIFKGIITINTPTVFEFRHRCSVTGTNTGLGSPASLGDNELYASVKIRKLK